MGAGRKKTTLTLKEKAQPSCTVNGSAPARNLRKTDLAAVIFGCKHNTIRECYSELLFGMFPAVIHLDIFLNIQIFILFLLFKVGCFLISCIGLPSPHFAYVKNISPGLPLFLFNYSDRKLYGIFEAASHGQMNINAYGWTGDGAEYSPYPAQVYQYDLSIFGSRAFNHK